MTEPRDDKPPFQQYLGDSVYVRSDGSLICLFTDNGYGPRETIYLEPEVYEALRDFAKQIGWEPNP